MSIAVLIYLPRQITRQEMIEFLQRGNYKFGSHHYGEKSWAVHGKSLPFILSLDIPEKYVSEDDEMLQRFFGSNQVTHLYIEPRNLQDPVFRSFIKSFCETFDGLFDINDSTANRIEDGEKFERDAPLKAFLENRTF